MTNVESAQVQSPLQSPPVQSPITGGRHDRVARHTSHSANRAVRTAIETRVRACASAPSRISPRLEALDLEWDIERAIEANAATLALTGLALSQIHDRRWLALSGVVGAFLLQHAAQGWCPPVPVLRAMGFRTRREIEIERTALKILRGDFGGLGDENGPPKTRAQTALALASA